MIKSVKDDSYAVQAGLVTAEISELSHTFKNRTEKGKRHSLDLRKFNKVERQGSGLVPVIKRWIF